MDIYTGWPGSVHDAHVFVNSPIYEKGMSWKLFQGVTKQVCNEDLPITVLGDSAYTLLSGSWKLSLILAHLLWISNVITINWAEPEL